MQVIMLKDVKKVGRKGEVVRVRDGYGRNYLIPNKFALQATRANEKFAEEQTARAAKRFEAEREAALKLAEKLGKVKLTIEAKAGEKDKLFGSVTSEDIRQALAEKGHEFDKREIHPEKPIKTLGIFNVLVDVFPGVKATISLKVTAKKS